MANIVKIKRSAVASKIPTTADLELGELAINTFDGKLFTRKDDGTASIIEIGSGGGGGGGITYSLKTSNYTASDKEGILADTTAGTFTVTLPASPAIGASVVINDAADSFGTNNLIVSRNGSTIETIADNLILDLSSVSVSFIYTGTTWQVYSLVVTGVPAGTYATLTGAETLTNKTLTSPTLTGTTSFTGPYHNSYLTQYGSMFIEGTSTNNIVQVSSTGVSTGGGLWSTGVGNTLFSNAGLYFKINTTLRDQDTPTGGTIALSIENNTNAIFAGTVTANSVLLTGNTGTVTSVSGTGTVNGLTLTGTVTNSGSLTLGGTLSNVSLTSQVTDTLPVTSGGTGVTTSTGTGSVVLSNTPTLVTPILGVASATSIATGLGLVGTPSYTFTDDLNTGMWSPAADTLAFSEGGAEAMRITSAGNVGIGTSAPSFAKLQVANGGAEGLEFQPAVVAGTNRILSYNRATNGYNALRLDGEREEFYTGGTERMRITSAGNVGIGTTGPSAKLDVVAAAFTGGPLIGVRYNTSNYRMGFGIANSNGFPFVGLNVNNSADDNGTFDISSWASRLRMENGSFQFQTSSVSGTAGNAITWNTHAYLDASGNLGIGTTTPTTKLDVRGAAVGANVSAISIDNTSAGSGSPANTVSLNFSNAGSVKASITGAVYGDGYMAFATNTNVEKMRLTAAGSLGIGTTAPSARLSVVPTSNPASPTGGLQTSIGEASDNAAYQMRMGYILDTTYKSVINSISGGVGADLLLNPSGGSVIVGGNLTLSTKIIPNVQSIASAATITPNANTDTQVSVAALAVAATIAIPSGTALDGQKLMLRFKDNGTGRALTWITTAGGYRVIGLTLPTTTTATKTLYIGCIYNALDGFWDVIAKGEQA